MKSKFLKFKPNKIFIIITILVVILLTWTLIKSFSEVTESSAWDGVVAKSFTSGTGSLNNPYVISNPSQLAYFKLLMESEDASVYADKYYSITNNLDYGNYDISINNEIPFSGVIDGNYNFVSNAVINNSLFNSIDNAEIKNINLQKLSVFVSNSTGIISNSINSSNLNNVIIDGTISKKDDFEDEFVVSGIANNDNDSSFSNIIVNFNVLDDINYYSIINNSNNTELNNILVNKKYNIVSSKELDTSMVYTFILDNGNVQLDNKILDKFENVYLENNVFSFVLDNKKSSKGPNRSAAISLHASGVDGDSIYINEIETDDNYYNGLNYTEILNTNGVIPNGNNQNIYSDTNMATVYIRYSGADINDSSTFGTVSVTETVSNYYYFKKYPVKDGYITFNLIDNPWANRPSGRAFNGWVTDYDNAIISLDMDTYTRSVKIPVNDISNPISITFYSSWTVATTVTSTNNITNLKNIGMTSFTPGYGDLTVYYIRKTVNNGSNYPNSNNMYTLNGNKITRNSRCNTSGGCVFVDKNTSNTFNANAAYYKVTENGNGPATVEPITPRKKAITYYENGGSAAGYFLRVNSGSENIYSSTGDKLSSCSGTCYKLLQYSDGDLDPDTTYYYLTTRDTNIFAVSSNNTIYTSNISTSRPMTITGINDGADNSSTRTIQLDNNFTINSDLRIEFVRFYTNSYNTDVDEFSNSNNSYKIIGNYKNLKIGRGIKRYTYYGDDYLTATSFVGGTNGSMTTLSRYSLIVESGFYQNGSGVGYGSSASTHRVNANVILGNDYDRVTNKNNNLIIYYCYAGSWASNLYNSSSSNDTYDFPAINSIVKSGTFGENKADYAAGIYVGGRGRGTHYAIRSLTVEGGNIYNVIGGPMSSDDRNNKNDIIINIKDGIIDMVFGGAGVSNTVGNRILNITGGTINYSILGGSNAYSAGSNNSNPYGKIDGNTLIYVGGSSTVGIQTDSLYNISAGNVFGAGNGRSGELDVGAVNNSNVIIGKDAKISGSVYGGGNFGAVGGNTVGSVLVDGTGSNIPQSGVYEDNTVDNSIRYFGANPDNYIMFNGDVYRIIGLFNNISTSNGSKRLVRIVKDTSLGNQAWGSTGMTTVETNTSTETSDAFFGTNTYNYTNYYKNYYNYYVKNDNTKSNMYNYLNSTYYNGLNNTYKNLIEEVNWGLGATNNTSQNANSFYNAERGNGVVNYLTGINQTSNGSSSSSSLFKIGLFYPSDYGFANNDSTCLSSNLNSYSSNCRSNNWMSSKTNAWTLMSSTNVNSVTKTYQVSRKNSGWFDTIYTMNRYYHVVNSNFVTGNNGLDLRDIYYTGNDNDNNNYYNTGAVYPSFYLKDDVTISSGTGTSSDPYIIGSSSDKLTDIIYELMHPTSSEPVEPVVITYDESDYQNFTHVQVLGGTISGSVYGAGNSNGAGNNTKDSNGAVALSKVTIDVNGGKIDGSVYGGSNAYGTVFGDVFVNVENGKIAGSIYGGGKGGYSSSSDGTYVSCNVNVNIGNENTNDLIISNSVYGGSAFGTVNATNQSSTTSSYATKVTVNNGVIVGSVFGGGQGDADFTPRVVGPINVTINDGDITNVFGGNDQAGEHNVTNKVYLNGGTIDSVYGGGNKSSVDNTHVYLKGATVTNIYGGSNTLGDVSQSLVEINSGTVQNVYGGNNEGGTCDITNVKVEGSASINGSLYGGGNKVSTATTNVILNSAGSLIPNVYGGGNNAGVTNTNITQNGVNVTNMFGGSNSSGTVQNSIITHNSASSTNIFGGNNAGGNTINSTINYVNGTTSTIYGGGNEANSSSSNINISGGTVTDMFGGGNSAGLTDSHIHMTAGTVSNIYGGSNNSGLVNTTNILIDNTTGTVNNIYGGGNHAQVGETNVTINNGTFGSIYGGGNLAQVNGNTLLDLNGGTINGNVYGGGNFGVVKGSSDVNITDTTILGSAYAGGNGSSATLEGNTNITIDGGTTIGSSTSVPPASGSVFGGGNQAYTGIESNNNSTSTVNIVSGNIYGNVYGGANTSVIYGNTNVNIGYDAVNDNTLTKGNVFIKGHVFGGGEANASGSEIYDWFFISVTQGTHINIDANGHEEFSINGSFYGGGNASSASGESFLSIKNYGVFANPKNNISIQRVDYVTIDNSSILLKGAVDRANEYDKELFSISRVKNLKIKNNSALYLETGANLLEQFESLDNNGNKASVIVDEENNTVSKTVDNRIYMYEGKNLNIAKDQQVKDYGTVSGMTFLGIFNYDNDRHVNTGIYNINYNAGDLLDWSGTFTKGSYVLGKHVSNHNIKVDGFYSNYINEESTINEVKYIEPTPDAAEYYMWFIGEDVREYNVNLVASKYSTLGSVEYSFIDFYKPNTSFQILSFDSSEIAEGITLVDRNSIPRIASTPEVANNQFGLSMEASDTGWLTTGKTSFFTSEPSINGVTYYEGENSSVVPTMLFYLYHSKNLSEEKQLGTVRISIMAITKLNALSNEIKRLVVNVNMSSALFQTTDYEGTMTPGDKYELFTSTATNITTKSKFSTYYSLFSDGENLYKTGYHRALVSSFVFPENTKITMLDFVNGVPEYYYHIITASDVQAAQAEYNTTTGSEHQECSYLLSMFTKMGSKSNNSNYDDASMNNIYYDGTDSNEEFIFIVDFSDTEISGDKLDNTLFIEIRDSNNEAIIGVLGQQRAQLTYNLYSNCDSTINMNIIESLNPLYIGYSDIFDVLVDYQNSSISGVKVIDTQYFDSKLGLQIYVKNNEGNMVSGTDLTGTYFLMDGVKYYPDIDGITHIKMSDKVGNTEKWITFNTDNSSLATGSYTFMFEAFGSSDGIYYGNSSSNEVSKNITIINTIYGFKPELNQNNVIFSGTNNNKNLIFSVDYESRLDNPNIRLAMYRRKYDEVYDTSYELVDLQSYTSESLHSTDNQNEYLIISNPSQNNGMTIMMNDNLLTGTYRLSFRLYDGNTMIGEVIRYIVIK